MTASVYNLDPTDPRVAEVIEICLKFGITKGRAGLVAHDVIEMMDKPHKGNCPNCERSFRAKDPRAIYCSSACRVAACRERNG